MINNKLLLKYSYILNTIFIILHEMDAVFWKEWRLFGIPNDTSGLKLFIILHIPLYLILFIGMVNIDKKPGKFISLGMSTFFIFHFFIHVLVLNRGYFNDPISFGIITTLMIISIIQVLSTVISLKHKNN